MPSLCQWIPENPFLIERPRPNTSAQREQSLLTKATRGWCLQVIVSFSGAHCKVCRTHVLNTRGEDRLYQREKLSSPTLPGTLDREGDVLQFVCI